jgi:hypothetical protein
MAGRDKGSMMRELALFLCIMIVVTCHGCKHSLKKPEGRGRFGICILYPDSDSGVKGIVTMHQQSPLHPVYY